MRVGVELQLYKLFIQRHSQLCNVFSKASITDQSGGDNRSGTLCGRYGRDEKEDIISLLWPYVDSKLLKIHNSRYNVVIIVIKFKLLFCNLLLGWAL